MKPLQWGHGHVAVEMGRPFLVSKVLPLLQWGHGHVAVEISYPDETGGTVYRLQWGHGHVAVEMSRRAHREHGRDCFNGATATWPWKST